jgi:thioredoxin-related protein
LRGVIITLSSRARNCSPMSINVYSVTNVIAHNMKQNAPILILRVITALVLLYLTPCAMADRMDEYQIGGHGMANIKHPSWFKESFLDLREDLNDAQKAGKRGVIVFFSQKSCSHCQAFIDTTLNDPATKLRVQKQYDVVGLDIFNDLELTDIDGTVTTVKDFAEKQRARLTPTLLFYGVENIRLLKIIGFYPPEKFNLVLDYIDGSHYKRVNLRQFIQTKQTKSAGNFQELEFDYKLFAKPPHLLDRTKSKGERPILVVFDKPNCNPCDRFRSRVLSHNEVRHLMPNFKAIHLDASDNVSKIIVTNGRQLTPRQWADDLQLTYDISVVFFDEHGKEVHRLDAETGKDRMAGSMQYVLEKAYKRHEQFLRWRKENALKKKEGK